MLEYIQIVDLNIHDYRFSYPLNYTVVAADRKLNKDDGEVAYTVKDVIPVR